MENDKVSIVLPTYNGARYIRKSIDSCLNQTYSNIELIIVDDGSKDETPEVIGSYKDDRITYIRHKENMGLPEALNTGFKNSSGDYLTWTSDDNFYAKKAIKEMLSFLKEKRCSFVYCDYYRFKNKDLPGEIFKLPYPLSLDKWNQIGACFLYSRKVFEAIGDHDPETRLAEDYDYWIRISKRFSMYHLNMPLYYYRVHDNSLFVLKYYEVQIVSYLVRLKNEILSVDQVTELFIGLCVKKREGFSKINRILLKLIFLRQIRKIFHDYKKGILDLKRAKSSLAEIINIKD